MIAIKNILVPTDFGEASEAALTYGRDLARVSGATLHVLSVADNLATRYTVDMYAALLPDVQRDYEASLKKELDALLSQEDRTQLRARAIVRTSNATACTIVGYAKEARIDLIVMGTHGRGAVTHFFMGSVAEQVVRTAPCPVLTLRHPEREFITPDWLVAAKSA